MVGHSTTCWVYQLRKLFVYLVCTDYFVYSEFSYISIYIYCEEPHITLKKRKAIYKLNTFEIKRKNIGSEQWKELDKKKFSEIVWKLIWFMSLCVWFNSYLWVHPKKKRKKKHPKKSKIPSTSLKENNSHKNSPKNIYFHFVQKQKKKLKKRDFFTFKDWIIVFLTRNILNLL